MPVVHVSAWEGFGKEKAETLIDKITEIFAEIGIPREAVEVIVQEVPKSHWGIGGKPASQRFPGP